MSRIQLDHLTFKTCSVAVGASDVNMYVKEKVGSLVCRSCMCYWPGTLQTARVIQAAYNLNNKLRLTTTSDSSAELDHCSFLLIDTPAVIVSALKKVYTSRRL
jgi:hypothetical protein